MKVLKGISFLFVALALFYLADYFVEYRLSGNGLILCALVGLVISFLVVTYPKRFSAILLVVVISLVAVLGIDLFTTFYNDSRSGEIALVAGDKFLAQAVNPEQSESGIARWVKEILVVKYGILFGEWLVYDRISAQLLWGEIYNESLMADKDLVQLYRQYEAIFTTLSALLIGLIAQILLSRWIGFIGLFLPIVGFMVLWYIYVDLPSFIFALYFIGLILYLIMRQSIQIKAQERDRQGIQRLDLKYYRLSRVVLSSFIAGIILVSTTSLIVSILPIKAINTSVDWALPNVWGARTDYDTQNYRLYSLGNTGYQGNGSRLGGPVGALDEETPLFWLTMEDVPQYSVYLKGQVKHIYDGNSWVKTDQIYKNNFENYLEHPENRKAIESKNPNETSGKVTFDNLKTISVFTPIGFYDSSLSASKVFVSMENQAFYKGGVFVSYIKEYSYKATQKDFTAPTPEDLQVSETISPQVVNFMKLFQNYASTPKDRVSLMVRYLKQNYTYNLAVSSKRVHPDFVTNFLVETREGYCTYFASAMVIMARVNGIPARYVEGFRVDPSEFDPKSGKAKVTEADAHAWVEVYFEDEGWRVVEATAPFTATALQPELASRAELSESQNKLLQSGITDPAINGSGAQSADELERMRLRDLNLEGSIFEDGSGYGDYGSSTTQMAMEAEARAKAERDAKNAQERQERLKVIGLSVGLMAILFVVIIWWWPVIVRFKRVDHSKLTQLIYGYEDLFSNTQQRLLAKGAILANARDLSVYEDILPAPETLLLWEKILFAKAATISTSDVEFATRTLDRAYSDLLEIHKRSNGLIKHWIFRALKRV